MPRSVTTVRTAGLLLAACLLGGSAGASVPPAASSSAAFDRAVVDLTDRCPNAPSTECIDTAWRAADADADGRLSASELEALHANIGLWADARQDQLPGHTVSSIAGGLNLVSAIGVGRLLTAFDEDGDGLLSPEELLSDIRLDERPIDQVLTDPKSFDHRSLSRRLATISPLLAGWLRNAPLHQP